MAVEYALIVSGDTAPEEMRPRLYGDASPPPEFNVSKGVWTADERDRMGFILFMRRGEHGYFDVTNSGDDEWTFEPARYLHVGARADKDKPPGFVNEHLVRMVARVLATGNEDMALIQNGEILLLERSGGELRRIPAGFWNNVDAETQRLIGPAGDDT